MSSDEEVELFSELVLYERNRTVGLGGGNGMDSRMGDKFGENRRLVLDKDIASDSELSLFAVLVDLRSVLPCCNFLSTRLRRFISLFNAACISVSASAFRWI